VIHGAAFKDSLKSKLINIMINNGDESPLTKRSQEAGGGLGSEIGPVRGLEIFTGKHKSPKKKRASHSSSHQPKELEFTSLKTPPEG